MSRQSMGTTEPCAPAALSLAPSVTFRADKMPPFLGFTSGRRSDMLCSSLGWLASFVVSESCLSRPSASRTLLVSLAGVLRLLEFNQFCSHATLWPLGWQFKTSHAQLRRVLPSQRVVGRPEVQRFPARSGNASVGSVEPPPRLSC